MKHTKFIRPGDSALDWCTSVVISLLKNKVNTKHSL